MAATNVQAFSGDVEISSNLAVNTNDLFVDTLEGRVGIGVTLPAYDFDIQNSSDDANKTLVRLYSPPNATGVSNTNLRLEKGTGYGGILKGFLSQGVGSGLSFNTLNGGTELQAMTIVDTGNVGIGTTDPQYKLDVSGSLAQSGQKIYPERRWEVDLSSGTSTSNFYPLYLETDAFDANIGPYMFPVTFNVIGESLAGTDPFSEETLVGYARGGGATDHVGMCKVHSRRYDANEFRCLGIWEGTANQLGIVIYLRGGYKYSVITNATNVVVNKSSYGQDSSIWAVKNASKTDVIGTSANINELQDVSAFVQVGEVNSFTGSLILPQNYQRVGIGTANPLHALDVKKDITTGSSTTTNLQTHFNIGNKTFTQGSALMGYSGRNPNNIINAATYWKSTGGFYGTAGYFGIAVNNDSIGGADALGITDGELTTQTHIAITSTGNVGIGVTNPGTKLDVNGSMQSFSGKHVKTVPIRHNAYNDIAGNGGFVRVGDLVVGSGAGYSGSYAAFNWFGTSSIQNFSGDRWVTPNKIRVCFRWGFVAGYIAYVTFKIWETLYTTTDDLKATITSYNGSLSRGYTTVWGPAMTMIRTDVPGLKIEADSNTTDNAAATVRISDIWFEYVYD